MKTRTHSESRTRYAATLNEVVDDREEIVITRAGGDPVVMVALDDSDAEYGSCGTKRPGARS